MGTAGEVELYPTRLDYNWAENLLTGVGEEKYTVETGDPGDGQTQPINNFKFVSGENLVFMDGSNMEFVS